MSGSGTGVTRNVVLVVSSVLLILSAVAVGVGPRSAISYALDVCSIIVACFGIVGSAFAIMPLLLVFEVGLIVSSVLGVVAIVLDAVMLNGLVFLWDVFITLTLLVGIYFTHGLRDSLLPLKGEDTDLSVRETI